MHANTKGSPQDFYSKPNFDSITLCCESIKILTFRVARHMLSLISALWLSHHNGVFMGPG